MLAKNFSAAHIKERTRDPKYDDATNDRMDMIEDMLDNLHGKAEVIGEKIKAQDPLIGKMQQLTQQNREQMMEQRARMGDVMEQYA